MVGREIGEITGLPASSVSTLIEAKPSEESSIALRQYSSVMSGILACTVHCIHETSMNSVVIAENRKPGDDRPLLGYSLFMEDMVMTDPMLLAPCGMNCSICSAVLAPVGLHGCIEEESNPNIAPIAVQELRVRNPRPVVRHLREMPCAS
jgi:hypothetical protein